MAHTYISDLMHCVFSTKLRQSMIPPDMQTRLWSFMGGIARISVPATVPVAKAMQLIKGGSSKWLNENLNRDFAWQQAYGAFSVGFSQQKKTIDYINSQKQHHAVRSFEEEFVSFLRKHEIDYDPQCLWG